MEFPDLGEQCLVPSCKQLDFLPMRCDACQGIFCKDHFLYQAHSCEKSYLKDNQVPVCPLCDQPVPIARGEVPDIRVSAHIDNECQDIRAKNKRSVKSSNRIFTNKCNAKGCKQKEMIPVLCSDCKINFCLRHRHPEDHSCDPRAARIPKSFNHNSLTQSASASMSSIRATAASASRRIGQLFSHPSPGHHVQDQSGMSEDEALARAIQASLNSNTASVTTPSAAVAAISSPSLQEEEDRQLALAIAESQKVQNQQSTGRRGSNDRCNLN